MKGHSYNPEGCPKCGKIHIPPFKGKTFKQHPLQGKHHKEETKEKIKIARTGTTVSDETKLKMSNSHKGRSLEERGHSPDCGCGPCKAHRGECFGENHPQYIDGLRNNYPK